MDGMDFGGGFGGKMQGTPPGPMPGAGIPGLPGMPPGGMPPVPELGSPLMTSQGMGAPVNAAARGGDPGQFAPQQMQRAENLAPGRENGPYSGVQGGAAGQTPGAIPPAGGMDPQKKMMLAGLLAKLGGAGGQLMRRR